MGSFIKWLGHASFEIEVNDKVSYIDPYKGQYEDRADLILLMHSHLDHCDVSKIERIGGGSNCVCMSIRKLSEP